ncbi:MAG: hypothetical protein IAF58_05210 [Leptolyngbya sp.]|nr:hypothetical protein [Candidatus Melainabacteria bacterium]
MAKITSQKFSHPLKDYNTAEEQLELVANPLVKEILTKVLAENDADGKLGSSFGEGQVAG